MKHLFSPLKLRSLELKNRIVVSPMQQYSATDGIPNHWHLVHLGSRAVGGAALIITECTAVSPEGMNTTSDVGIWNSDQLQAWKPVVQFVQQQGAKIAVQLWHAGGKGSSKHPNEGMKPLPVSEGGWITKSASRHDFNGAISQEMTLSDIEKVKTDFIAAAKSAVEAGFDAIELHAAHGYLFHQFYSSVTNRREDRYGGSFENRIRLLVETVKETRNAIPVEMPLLVRISATDYIDSDDGWTLEDSIRLSEILKAEGVDLVTASGGGFAQVDPSIVKPGYQVPFSEKIRHTSQIATGAVGMITDAAQADEIIQAGKADLAVIAREHLRNPYFAIHAALELGEDIEIPWQYKRAF